MKLQPNNTLSKLLSFAKGMADHPNLEKPSTGLTKEDQLIGAITREWDVAKAKSVQGPPDMTMLPAYQDFYAIRKTEQEGFALYLAEAFWKSRQMDAPEDPLGTSADYVRQVMLHSLMQSDHPFSNETLIRIGQYFLQPMPVFDWHFFDLPLVDFLKKIKKNGARGKHLPLELLTITENVVERIKASGASGYLHPLYVQTKKLAESILVHASATHDIRPFFWQSSDVVGDFANHLPKTMSQEQRNCWYSVLHLTQKATTSKPPSKLILELEKLVGGPNQSFFAAILAELFEYVAAQKDVTVEKIYGTGTAHERRFVYQTFLYDANALTLKGLVWAALSCLDNRLLTAMGGLADRCFKKSPGKGYSAGAVGNAALWVMSESGRQEAIGYLSRLRTKNIQSDTRSLIDHYMADLAKKAGMTVTDLEDLFVPDFGLDEKGQLEQHFEGFRAAIRLVSVGKTSVEWFKSDGTPQKSVPTALKNQFPEAVKKLAALAKEIATTSTAQRDRFDRMLRIERRIPYQQFEKNFLHHGLLGWIARKLVWKITDGTRETSAFFTGKNWRDSTGQVLNWVSEGCSVQLWHPAGSPMDETLRWRAFLEDIRLVQPMKQAYREIYLLTDAELRTRNYSNRFAAHLLKQHQFASLARLRGWAYKLLGAYDDGRDSSIAVLHLPEISLRAEYWIQEVIADDGWNTSGIWQYVATDQVRFYRKNTLEPMNLLDVPLVVFSETMRDADLFVGVASVGNDPDWQDSGGLPVHRDYWQTYSFGELSEMAKSRRDILVRLVPRLKIAPVAEIKDRFLHVRGKLRTYKIHLGSGNILMEPNDQYLCIVPDRRADVMAGQGNLFLPFEGDNGLSVILSKAFMLAEDDKITDTSITRQIRIGSV